MPKWKVDILIPDQEASSREEAVIKALAFLLTSPKIEASTEAVGHGHEVVAVYGDALPQLANYRLGPAS